MISFAGANVTELAQRFGTPLYVVDERVIRDQCQDYRRGLSGTIPSTIAYSAKAFFCSDMARIVAEEDMWLDVNSGGELYAALEFGLNADRIIFHGNNKTTPELTLAVRAGVGRIVVDNECELRALSAVALREQRPVRIMLRVAPGVKPATHKYVQTGQIDSKFGLALGTDALMNAAVMADNDHWIQLTGVHAHVGSQLMTATSVCLGARRLVRLIADLAQRGIELTEIDVGGGLGVRYRDEMPQPVDQFAHMVRISVEDEAEELGVQLEHLIIEPGRSIVAEAAVALYTVGAVKTSPDGKRYVSVDGGMADNPRPALYGASYRVESASTRCGRSAEYDVVGRFCESGDVLARNVELIDPQPGDVLVVYSAGAYQMSMASNYNMVPRPAVVMVSGAQARLSVRRETYADLIRLDVGTGAAAMTAAGR